MLGGWAKKDVENLLHTQSEHTVLIYTLDK